MILNDPALDQVVRPTARAALLLGVGSLFLLPAWATDHPPQPAQAAAAAPASEASSVADRHEAKTNNVSAVPEQQLGSTTRDDARPRG